MSQISLKFRPVKGTDEKKESWKFQRHNIFGSGIIELYYPADRAIIEISQITISDWFKTSDFDWHAGIIHQYCPLKCHGNVND